jgi:dihydroorotase
MDLLIVNGTIVSPQGKTIADIAVKNGVIAEIATPGSLNDTKLNQTIDAKGLYILPGCMDAHIHFRDPGQTHKEDFVAGSMAAAAGGITTIFDMANNKPLIDGPQAVAEKIKLTSGRSYVDYCFHGLAAAQSIGHFKEMIDAGVRGFKGMMSISAAGTPTIDDGNLRHALAELRETDTVLTVHAENTSIIKAEQKKLQAAGRIDWRAHMESRPVASEVEAITRAILFAEEAGGRLHVAHIAAAKSVDIIRAAKQRGVRVTTETGPHNLVLTDADYERLGPSMFMNPPIRTAADQAALWEGVRDGTIDMISTDHAPQTEEDKFASNSVWASISGFCGIETSVPIMLTAINEGKLTLERYVAVSSFSQAQHFKIYPRKGAIQVGSDGDFTIVDMKKAGTIHKSELKSKTKVTPFDGFRYTGAPVYTIIRGNVVMAHGRVDPSKMIGQFL